jgi:hypothetical protein
LHGVKGLKELGSYENSILVSRSRSGELISFVRNKYALSSGNVDRTYSISCCFFNSFKTVTTASGFIIFPGSIDPSGKSASPD